MTIKKPILCLDFDGVLHSYTSGWSGADLILDPPTHGAMAFVFNALDNFQVAIFSSRSNAPGGIAAMKEWLAQWMETHLRKDHGLGGGDLRESLSAVLDEIQWPTEKPPALVTLDDRAVTFTGNWPGLDELRAFQPWNKRPAKTQPVLDAEAAEAQIAAWVAEVDELPDPYTSLMTVVERRHLVLLKRIADILR